MFRNTNSYLLEVGRQSFYIHPCRKVPPIDEFTAEDHLDLNQTYHSVVKIEVYGFRGSIYDLLHDYLSDQQYRALLRGDLSDLGVVSIRVPQGSTVGPLIIICLFINDLFCCQVFIIGSL